MPVRAIQRRTKLRARSRTQQGTLTPLSPLARFLTSSGSLSGCSFRIAECRSQVWIVVPVGVTGTRGRCAAFHSVQDAWDSHSPRCCSKSELSSATLPNVERHLLPNDGCFDALWLLVCWIDGKAWMSEIHLLLFLELLNWRVTRERTGDFISLSHLPHALVNYDTVWELEALGGSSWSSPTFTRIIFSSARKEEPCLQKCRGSIALKPLIARQRRDCISRSGPFSVDKVKFSSSLCTDLICRMSGIFSGVSFPPSYPSRLSLTFQLACQDTYCPKRTGTEPFRGDQLSISITLLSALFPVKWCISAAHLSARLLPRIIETYWK